MSKIIYFYWVAPTFHFIPTLDESLQKVVTRTFLQQMYALHPRTYKYHYHGYNQYGRSCNMHTQQLPVNHTVNIMVTARLISHNSRHPSRSLEVTLEVHLFVCGPLLDQQFDIS